MTYRFIELIFNFGIYHVLFGFFTGYLCIFSALLVVNEATPKKPQRAFHTDAMHLILHVSQRRFNIKELFVEGL